MFSESAIRERKRNKENLKRASLTNGASAYSDVLSPGSAGEKQQNANNVQPCMEEVYALCFLLFAYFHVFFFLMLIALCLQ